MTPGPQELEEEEKIESMGGANTGGGTKVTAAACWSEANSRMSKAALSGGGGGSDVDSSNENDCDVNGSSCGSRSSGSGGSRSSNFSKHGGGGYSADCSSVLSDDTSTDSSSGNDVSRRKDGAMDELTASEGSSALASISRMAAEVRRMSDDRRKNRRSRSGGRSSGKGGACGDSLGSKTSSSGRHRRPDPNADLNVPATKVGELLEKKPANPVAGSNNTNNANTSSNKTPVSSTSLPLPPVAAANQQAALLLHHHARHQQQQQQQQQLLQHLPNNRGCSPQWNGIRILNPMDPRIDISNVELVSCQGPSSSSLGATSFGGTRGNKWGEGTTPCQPGENDNGDDNNKAQARPGLGDKCESSSNAPLGDSSGDNTSLGFDQLTIDNYVSLLESVRPFFSADGPQEGARPAQQAPTNASDEANVSGGSGGSSGFTAFYTSTVKGSNSGSSSSIESPEEQQQQQQQQQAQQRNAGPHLHHHHGHHNPRGGSAAAAMAGKSTTSSDTLTGGYEGDGNDNNNEQREDESSDGADDALSIRVLARVKRKHRRRQSDSNDHVPKRVRIERSFAAVDPAKASLAENYAAAKAAVGSASSSDSANRPRPKQRPSSSDSQSASASSETGRVVVAAPLQPNGDGDANGPIQANVQQQQQMGRHVPPNRPPLVSDVSRTAGTTTTGSSGSGNETTGVNSGIGPSTGGDRSNSDEGNSGAGNGLSDAALQGDAALPNVATHVDDTIPEKPSVDAKLETSSSGAGGISTRSGPHPAHQYLPSSQFAVAKEDDNTNPTILSLRRNHDHSMSGGTKHENLVRDVGTTEKERLALKKRKRMDMRREYEEEVERQMRDSSESSAGELVLKPGKPVRLDEVLSDFTDVARLIVQAEIPFMAVHANAAYASLTGIDSTLCIGKPVTSLLALPDGNTAHGTIESAESNPQEQKAGGQQKEMEEDKDQDITVANKYGEQQVTQVGENDMGHDAAAAARARTTEVPGENREICLGQLVAACGFSQYHQVHAMSRPVHIGRNVSFVRPGATNGERELSGAAASATSVGRPIPSLADDSSIIPRNESDYLSTTCRMSVSPVVSSSISSSATNDDDTAIVTDAHGGKMNSAQSHGSKRGADANSTNASPKRRKHQHHHIPDRNPHGSHGHRHRLPHIHRGDVTHYVIQLEPIDGKKGLRSRESLTTSTASNTTAEAKLLGLTKDELRRRKLINKLSQPPTLNVSIGASRRQQQQQQQQQQQFAARQAVDQDQGGQQTEDDDTSASQELPVVTCG